MVVKNDFMPFGVATGANVMAQADYENMLARQTGFQSGTAISAQLNKVWRQASLVSAMIGQFTADHQALDVLDNGDVAALETKFINALKGALEDGLVHIAFNDTGAENQVIATATPTISTPDNSIVVFRKRQSMTNTGAITADFGTGAAPLVDNTGAAFQAGQILGGAIYVTAFYGSAWRVLGGATTYTNVTNLTANSGKAIQVQTGGNVDQNFLLNTDHNANPVDTDLVIRQNAAGNILNMNWKEFIASLGLLKTIEAATSYYVNVASGADSNDGRTSGTAFKTIQRAINEVNTFNLNGYDVTIHVAPGTYPELVELKKINGTGRIFLTGDTVNPASTVISSTNGPAIVANSVTGYTIRGFKLTANATFIAGMRVTGTGIWCASNSSLNVGDIEFGECKGAHCFVTNASNLYFDDGKIRITGSCPADGALSGAHIVCTSSSTCQTAGPLSLAADPELIIANSVNIPIFIFCYTNSFTAVYYESIAGAAYVNGQKYAASLNGVIYSGGGGANYYPGNTAGGTWAGGQYG